MIKKIVAYGKKSAEDMYFPVPAEAYLSPLQKPKQNPVVIKKLIQGTIQSAYKLKMPYSSDFRQEKLKPLVSAEEIELVTHLILSLEPRDAIEVALASQFVITYVQGLKESKNEFGKRYLDLFDFGHQVLETLQKYRCKGAQQISVQYNVSQGQVVNIKNIKKEHLTDTIEGDTI